MSAAVKFCNFCRRERCACTPYEKRMHGGIAAMREIDRMVAARKEYYRMRDSMRVPASEPEDANMVLEFHRMQVAKTIRDPQWFKHPQEQWPTMPDPDEQAARDAGVPLQGPL